MKSIAHISHRLKYTCAFDEGTRARPTPHFCKHYGEVGALSFGTRSERPPPRTLCQMGEKLRKKRGTEELLETIWEAGRPHRNWNHFDAVKTTTEGLLLRNFEVCSVSRRILRGSAWIRVPRYGECVFIFIYLLYRGGKGSAISGDLSLHRHRRSYTFIAYRSHCWFFYLQIVLCVQTKYEIQKKNHVALCFQPVWKM